MGVTIEVVADATGLDTGTTGATGFVTTGTVTVDFVTAGTVTAGFVTVTAGFVTTGTVTAGFVTTEVTIAGFVTRDVTGAEEVMILLVMTTGVGDAGGVIRIHPWHVVHEIVDAIVEVVTVCTSQTGQVCVEVVCGFHISVGV